MAEIRKAPESRKQADDLVNRLRKSGDALAWRLAKALDRCCLDDPCCLLACSKCRDVARKALVDAVVNLWDESPLVTAMAIIPADGVIAYDRLGAFDLNAFMRRHQVRLKRLLPKDVEAVGFVDVSLNTFDNAFHYWHVHLHLVTRGELDRPAAARVRQSYPADRKLDIYRPVSIKVVRADERRSATGYLIKSDFKRRSGFLAQPRSRRRPYRDHRSERMSASQACLLHMALANYKVLAPLMLIGLKRKRSDDPISIHLQRLTKRPAN